MTGVHDRLSATGAAAPRRAAAGVQVILIAAYLLGLFAYVRLGRYETCAHQARLQLDPNQATAAELSLLPGIGPKLAQRIVSYRDRCSGRPAFVVAEDLTRVHGIGPGILSRIRDYLVLPDGQLRALPGGTRDGKADDGLDE